MSFIFLDQINVIFMQPLYGAVILCDCIINIYMYQITNTKKVNRTVQGVPQSQVAAKRRHQEEEKKDEINVCKINKQMHEKHIDQLSLPQARWSQC